MPILGIMASSITASMLGDYESIATVTVGSGGQATAEFTSIPSSYTHLQIRFIEREETGASAGTSQLQVRFNNDSGSNYNLHRLYGTGSSALADNAGGSVTSIRVSGNSAASSAANVFGSGIIDILDYTNTNKNTTVRSLAGADFNNSNGIIFFSSGLWRNTAAITSIQITNLSAVDHNQHSSFALYGCK
jgi:hypothetical protein